MKKGAKILWLYGALCYNLDVKYKGVFMDFKPLQDRILVKRMKEEEKTAGGILIPETAKEKPLKGEVVAVGKGALNDKGEIIPMELSVGDVVFFNKWGGNEIKLDGEEYLVMKESDVLGVFKK